MQEIRILEGRLLTECANCKEFCRDDYATKSESKKSRFLNGLRPVSNDKSSKSLGFPNVTFGALET